MIFPMYLSPIAAKISSCPQGLSCRAAGYTSACGTWAAPATFWALVTATSKPPTSAVRVDAASMILRLPRAARCPSAFGAPARRRARPSRGAYPAICRTCAPLPGRLLALGLLRRCGGGGGQPQALDDVLGKLIRRPGGGEHQHARLVLGRLQLGELAVQQPHGEEMAVPGGQPGVRQLPADLEERQPGRRPPGQQLAPEGPLQGRAPGDRPPPRGNPFIHPGGDRGQPRLAVGIGEP